MHLIIKLANRCEQLPPSLYVPDVSLSDSLPTCGGYSDVHQGTLAGSKQLVAIKKPRIMGLGDQPMADQLKEAHKVPKQKRQSGYWCSCQLLAIMS
jgi:hypothetical protein